MKKMSQHRRMLVLPISLLMVLNLTLSLAVNPVNAKKDMETSEWWGDQVPGSMTVHKIRIAGNCIKIHGKFRMNVVLGSGYLFGDIWVAYEVIRYIEIYEVPDEVLNLITALLDQYDDLDDLISDQQGLFMQMFYYYPRSGWFTWHAANGNVVGKGTFVYDNLNGGRLWARGRVSVFVEGTFSVNGFFISHYGTYVVK